jgi:hypothetical protein
MEPTGHENPDLSRSIEIIRLLLGRIREEVPPGVKVILAHQGTDNFLMPKLGFSSAIFANSPISVLISTTPWPPIRPISFRTVIGARQVMPP